MEQQDIQSNHDFSRHPQKTDAAPGSIKVIGVGGGGGNAVNHMYRHGDPIVSFIVANTDRQALNNSPVPNKVLLGPSIAGGRGAGNKPDVAREAAEESAAEIAELLSREHTDMVFITAGMGGGTGTGASPVIARIAREQKILTIGIVTIPFLFEGQKKIIKALDGAKEMSRYVDALMVINNERLSEIYRDMNFLNAFRKADDILAMAAMSISEIITSDGYINLDFNDVNSTLRDGGTAIISTAAAQHRHFRVEAHPVQPLFQPRCRTGIQNRRDKPDYFVHKQHRPQCRHNLGRAPRPHPRRQGEIHHPGRRLRRIRV